MNQYLLLLLAFLAAASITRFANADKLAAPFRDRVDEYWTHRAIELLRENAAAALIRNADYAKAESVMEMKAAVYRLAFLGDEKWRRAAWKLDWMDVYEGFLKCPWCVSFWVFAAVDLTAWLVVLGAPWNVWGGPWWVTVPCVVLGSRWIYGLLAANLDH